jgi:hypothetical protein
VGVIGVRLLGLLLLVGAYAPLHRLLDPERTGPAGEATRQAAESAWGVALYGTLVVVGAALVLTILVPSDAPARVLARMADLLARPGRYLYAGVAAVLASVLSLAVAVYLYHGYPTSVDEMAQLYHAQALTAGRLAVPLPGDATAWIIQNGLVTPEGWASIYPPFHTVLLALGLGLGAPWLVGPLVVGVATWASSLSFEEHLGSRRGRVAALVLAVCPFWLLLGATYLSHATAAACIALVLWTGHRARDGGLGWAVASGAAMGAAVTARPWIGLVSSATLLVVSWWPARDRVGPRVGALVAGGLPFAALLGWWNTRLFGSPFRLGYSAAYGPPHSLGFHVDPWGNLYGPAEALAYTGADLVQLGAHLLQTPLPLLALIGVALLLGLRGRSVTPFLAWAATAVAANALYWHHGVHMGPRMLYESTPAWVALFVSAAAYLTSDAVPRARLRRGAGWAVAAAAAGAFLLVPGVLESAAERSDDGRNVARLPNPRAERPTLVFAHGSWSSRAVARLAGAGMRRDSVETALRRNDMCMLDLYARWREASPQDRASIPLPEVDLEPLPGTPDHLRRYTLSAGNRVWVADGALRDQACALNARGDQVGAVELEPLVWQAPPLPDRPIVLARDMGPEINARVLEAMGDPPAFIYVPVELGSEAPILLDYDDGMSLLWDVPRDPAR